MIYRMPLITAYGKFAPSNPAASVKMTRFSAIGIGQNRRPVRITGEGIGKNPSPIFFHGDPGIYPIGLTDAISEATFTENAGGTAVNDNSTFGGYTLGQIAEAVRRAGILT